MNYTTKQRLPYADAARALAICLVVILHIAGSLVLKGYAAGKLNWFVANFFESVTRISVPLFVLVSGTLLLDPHRNESMPIFFRKRFFKILIPLIGWSLIIISLRIYVEGDSFTIQQAIRAIIEDTVAFHLWFLYMILGLYLVVPILRVFTRTASEMDYKYFLVIWMIAVGLPPLLAQFFGIKLADFWVIVIGFSGYFIAGYFFSQVNYSTRSMRWAIALYIFALMVTIIGTYLLLRQYGKYDTYFYDSFSPNVIMMSLSAYYLLRWLPYERIYMKMPWMSKLVSIIYITSFGVYMVHVLLLSVLKSGRLGFVLNGASVAPGVGILLTFLVVMPLSIAIVYLMQRIPILKYLVP